MKIKVSILYVLTLVLPLSARLQEEESVAQWEELAEQEDGGQDAEAVLMRLDEYRRHPLDLNQADADDLEGLGLLSNSQILRFLEYRILLGPLISLYEIQAVPGWDLPTIRKVLPYVAVNSSKPGFAEVKDLLKKGQQVLLVRYSRSLTGNSAGDGVSMLGPPFGMMFRYRYSLPKRIKWGFTIDKDAGEAMWSGNGKGGFDFASFHFQWQPGGLVKRVVAGDFTVCLGQGLLQWQRLAFGAGSASMNIKRQAPVLQAYTSSGEFNFHRGLGVTLARGNWAATAFISGRRMNANLQPGENGDGEMVVSSLQTSGYHRTASELSHRRVLPVRVAGINVRYGKPMNYFGINLLNYTWGYAFVNSDELYKRFAFSGKRLSNASIDFGFSRAGIHFFGEAAVSDRLAPALITGMLLSPDRKLDCSLLFRYLSPGFHSFFSRAFTAGTAPANERGIYAGLSWRLPRQWQLDLSLDGYHFPWLRYRVSAPSGGQAFKIQMQHSPARSVQWTIRFRWHSKGEDYSGDTAVLPVQVRQVRKDLRVQLVQQLSRRTRVRIRADLVSCSTGVFNSAVSGFLCFADCSFPVMGGLKASFRLQWFDAGDYDARVYAQETDLLYSYSVPAFYGRGVRAYVSWSGKGLPYFRERAKAELPFRYWIRLAANLGKKGTEEEAGTEPEPKGWGLEFKFQVEWLIGR